MSKAFLLKILLIICFGTTVGQVTKLKQIAQLFENERISHLWHDIIIFGDFAFPSDVRPEFPAHFQVALCSSTTTPFNESNPLDTNLQTRQNKHSLIFVYVSHSEENVFEIIKKITMLSIPKNETTNGSSTDFLNRRIFFILWPIIETPETVLYKLQNDSKFLDSVLSLSLTQEVYVLVWSQDGSGQLYTTDIIEVFGIVETVPVVQSVGPRYFNKASRIETTELLRIAARRNDFRGLVFKTVAENDTYYEAEVSVRAYENGTVYFKRGSSFNILKDLMWTLNFRHEPILGKGWTEKDDNETGSGITGLGLQVVEYEADICISTSTMEVYIAKYITFVQPVGNEESFVFFRQPSVTSARNIFMMPFQPVLWFTIFGCWLGIMIFTCAIASPTPAHLGHIGTSRMYSRFRRRQENFHWYDAYIWAIGSACQQGWFGSPLSISLRVLFVVSLLTNLVIYSFYTAAFVAAISAPIVPVTTFNDLKKYSYVVFANPSNPGFVSSFAEPQERDAILESSDQLFGSDTEAVAKILQPNSKYAAILGLDGFYSVGLGEYGIPELCQIDKMKGREGARVKDAMFVRKGAPYKEMIGFITVKLIERGLARRYWMSYEVDTELRCLKNTTKVIELDILDCYTAFVILTFAYMLAFFAAVFERRRRRSYSPNILHFHAHRLLNQGKLNW